VVVGDEELDGHWISLLGSGAGSPAVRTRALRGRTT
jgi:hypothetical protein